MAPSDSERSVARVPKLHSAFFALPALLGSLFSAGCESCQRDRPYTPFRVEASVAPSAAGTVPEPTPSALVAARSPEVPTIVGRKLEPPLGRFEVGPRVIELPKDLLAEQVLERPSALPGQPDALVWVVPAKPDAEWNGPMGELWLFPAAADAKKIFALPGWVPSGPGCAHDTRLAIVGTATALVDLHAKCERSAQQRSPTRAIALLTLGSAPTFLLGLRVAEAAPDEVLAVTARVSDRDADGREDPSFHFDMQVPSATAHVVADLGWLDRAAGPSVDEGHFAASLEPAIATWEATLGKKAKLPAILTELAAMRRLLASLCQQSATPRIFDWRGEPLRCPSTSAIASRLARIEVKAALGLGDPLEAARALAYASTWFGGIPSVEREELRRRIEKSLALVKVGLPVPTSVRPAISADAVRLSPLMFDSDGSALFVQVDRGGLERITFDGTSTNTTHDLGADAGIPAGNPPPAIWPLAVTAADGRRWSAVVPACDRSELSLAFKTADGSMLPLVPTRLLAPRPGVCRNPAAWPIATAPIAWRDDLPVALIDGVCWPGPGTQLCPTPDKLGKVLAGSPRSPDGRRLVVMTSLGPIVIGGARPELWVGAALDGKRLSDCVVANEAKAIACVAGNSVLFVARPEPAIAN